MDAFLALYRSREDGDYDLVACVLKDAEDHNPSVFKLFCHTLRDRLSEDIIVKADSLQDLVDVAAQAWIDEHRYTDVM